VLELVRLGAAPAFGRLAVLVAPRATRPRVGPARAPRGDPPVWSTTPAACTTGGCDGDLGAIHRAFLGGTALRLAWLDPARAREEPLREAWRAAIALLDRWRGEARELPSPA
jgi:hypothetical protein